MGQVCTRPGDVCGPLTVEQAPSLYRRPRRHPPLLRLDRSSSTRCKAGAANGCWAEENFSTCAKSLRRSKSSTYIRDQAHADRRMNETGGAAPYTVIYLVIKERFLYDVGAVTSTNAPVRAVLGMVGCAHVHWLPTRVGRTDGDSHMQRLLLTGGGYSLQLAAPFGHFAAVTLPSLLPTVTHLHLVRLLQSVVGTAGLVLDRSAHAVAHPLKR